MNLLFIDFLNKCSMKKTIMWEKSLNTWWNARRLRFSTRWINFCAYFHFSFSRFLFRWIRTNSLIVRFKIEIIKEWSLQRLNFDSTIEKEDNKLLISEQQESVRICIHWFSELNDFYLIIELTILSIRFLLNDFKSFEFWLNTLSMTFFNVIF